MTDGFRIPHDVVSRELDGETVLMNVATGHYFALPGVGSLVWARLEQGDGLEAIADAVVAAYAIDRETARADVGELVEALLARGLIEAP